MFALGNDVESSNADLERRVAQFLSTRHLFSLRHLRVEARSGVVTLHGRVYSFHEKQIGLTSAQRVAGVLRVVDAISVGARSDDARGPDEGFSAPDARWPSPGPLKSGQEYDRLGEEFEKKEHQLFGDDGFERTVARIATIEKSLGISDLAMFTPPE